MKIDHEKKDAVGLEREFPSWFGRTRNKRGRVLLAYRTFMLFKSWLGGIRHNMIQTAAVIYRIYTSFRRYKMAEGIFEKPRIKMLKNHLTLTRSLIIISLVEFVFSFRDKL